jgi:hypothetical protein
MSSIPFNRVKNNGKVELWDMGPKRPEPPNEPAKPDAALKGADKAAAEVEYEDACERYKQQLRKYTTDKIAYLDWHDKNGGPIKVDLWGVDARFAMEVEEKRFKLDLPKGQKPGRAQVEAEEMAAAEADALIRAQAHDPQFGQAGARP